MSLDPDRLTALRRTAAAAGVGRRSFLRGASLSALALGTPGLLAACGTEAQTQSADTCSSTDKSDTEKKLIFANWPAYIDRKGKHRPTLEAFEKQSGISVDYLEEINDNATFFGQVQTQLGDCQSIGRDIIVMSDTWAGRMIDYGWMQELDRSNLPTVEANLVSSLRKPPWDPERKYSVPWQSGLTGIAYNAKYTGEIKSFEELITRKDLHGKISLLTEMEDTMLFMLLIDGADPEDFSDEEWDAALGRLEDVVGSGQVRKFTGNDYIRDLDAGNIVAAEAWSGDVKAMQFDNPDIKWVGPEEGLGLWSDNMMVPNKATHKTNAEALMDYYYDPKVAAELVAWVNYICPVEGAREEMEKIDPSLADSQLIFPTEEFLADASGFMPLDDDQRTRYERDFTGVIGG